MSKSKETKEITIEPLKETTMRIELVGTKPLVLHKPNRYYEQCEKWKQNNPRGTNPPKVYDQKKNIWESLITSIHWQNPITYHDEDISLYTEEEWINYMKTNHPCILGSAFKKSFKETFVTFYKEKTKKNGTDLERGLVVYTDYCPISFGSVEHEETIVPTGTNGFGSPVLCAQNIFYNWSCTIEVSCPDCVFPYDTILSIIAMTGSHIGIGSRRKDDKFGRYTIGKVEILSA